MWFDPFPADVRQSLHAKGCWLRPGFPPHPPRCYLGFPKCSCSAVHPVPVDFRKLKPNNRDFKFTFFFFSLLFEDVPTLSSQLQPWGSSATLTLSLPPFFFFFFSSCEFWSRGNVIFAFPFPERYFFKISKLTS